jgi:hypothetical protein
MELNLERTADLLHDRGYTPQAAGVCARKQETRKRS